MTVLKPLLLGLALAGTSAASPVFAAESTAAFQSSASISSSCSIVSPRPVKFGVAYDPVNTHATVANKTSSSWGSVSVTCNLQPQPIFVKLNEGLTPSAGSSCATPLRNMVSANGDRLPYTLFVGNGAAATTAEWGCDDSNQKSLSFTELQKQTVAIAGRIDPGLNVVGGAYADTVMATVVF